MKFLSTFFNKKEDSGWSEYIEFDAPFITEDMKKYNMSERNKYGGLKYVRISKEISLKDHYRIEGKDIKKGVWGKIVKKNEYEQIKNAGNKVKRFNFVNTLTVNLGLIQTISAVIIAIVTVLSFCNTYFNKTAVKNEQITVEKSNNS